jgi:UDP-glucose 4-epimerase
VGTGGAAALGAAGAAVALIGTAAVLRQARGRRRT